MIIIRFKDAEAERRAIGYLAGRFPGKSYANGETLVPDGALPHLAVEGIEFTVTGPAKPDGPIDANSGPWARHVRPA